MRSRRLLSSTGAGQVADHGSVRRVTIMTHGLAGGGAEHVVTWLAGELQRRGWSVILLSISGTGCGSCEPPQGVELRCLGLEADASNWRQGVVNNLHRIRILRRHLRLARPDVVLSFGDTTNVTTLIAAVGMQTPVVVSERTEPRRHHIPRPWRLLRRVVYPRAATVVVQTDSVASWARSFISPSRVVVIRNAAVVRSSGSAAQLQLPDRFVLGVGRLEPVKRFDALIEYFAEATVGRDDWHLVIAGDGSERATLIESARRLGVASRVHFPGRVTDMGSLYSRASIFCLTSAYEGYPNALLEALSAGVASVAVACLSGPAEMISHDRTGLLVPENDGPAFVRALATLLSDAGLRRELGAAARLAAAEWSQESVARQWHSLLASLGLGEPMATYERE